MTQTSRLMLAALLSTTGCAIRTPSVVAGASAPAALTRGALVSLLDSIAAAPEFRNAHWGMLVVDPATGDTLYSRNAGKLFMPASNMKIITGAVALELLGADYRYRTPVVARGRVIDSTLVGDLAIAGRGDPTVSDQLRVDALQPLREVADSIRARGIVRIRGRIVSVGDAFPDAPLGYGWAWDDLDYPYAAGVDELLFNEGFSRLVVRASDRLHALPTVTVAPAPSYPTVRITATTVAPRDPADTTTPRPRLTFTADSAPGTVVLTGAIVAGDTAVLEVAHRDPSAAFLAAFRDALRERGIAIDSTGATTADSTAADTLAVIVSPPLREILPALEKPSQNQIAEALLKTLALERTGIGTADSGRRVVERQLLAWGIDSTGFVVRDGSGLSRHNYLSPEAIVRVLDAMRRQPTFTVFYDALPVAGVDGTIRNRMRGSPAAGNVRAKTGTIDKARALSGYVTTSDGRLLIFSFLANNYTVRTREVDRAVDLVLAGLAASRSLR